MSTTPYVHLPNASKTVKYSYFYKKKWQHGQHVCYEKTDEDAIASCYKHILVAYMPDFHITEIITETYN